MQVRKVLPEEKQAVFALYDSVKKSPFCTWNAYYPSEEEWMADMAHASLYGWYDGERLVAVLSVVGENEMDDFSFWSIKEGAKEIARVAVTPEAQGHGMAKEMLRYIEKELANEGFAAIHLTVAVKNLPARKTYRQAGYSFLKQVFLYGHDFYACEKQLNCEAQGANKASF